MRRAGTPQAKGASRVVATSNGEAHVEGVRFSAYLQALSSEIRKARSGEKTKLRLMSAGVALLEDCGFRDLNVEDVSRSSGMAKGTFYIHFNSKEEFLAELSKRYVDFELATAPSFAGTSTFKRLRAFVSWYERTFALNVGVLRCLVQMGEVSAEMRALWHRRNKLIVDRAQAQLFNSPIESGLDPELARLALRTPGAMLDQSLFERHRVQVGPGRYEPDDIELLVELHTLLIYRAVYGSNPPVKELNVTRPLLSWPKVD